MASVNKISNGRWRVRFRAPDGGSRTRTFDRKLDADRFVTSVDHERHAGTFVDPALGKRTVASYADEWLATKAGVSERTRINVAGRVGNYAKPFLGDMPIAAVRPMHARAFVAELVNRGLAPATVKAIALTTGQVFSQAVDDGLIGRSPFAGVEMPPERHRAEVRFLDADDVNVLAAAIDARYRAAVYLAAYGGLRAGELWAVRLDRVNVLARTIDVVESLSEIRGQVSIGPTKTGKVRTITVPRFLAELIGEHVGRYPARDGYLFSALEGGVVRHRNFMRRHYQPACVAAELRGLRFHDLRHTCAALLIANGRHLEEVKDYLGHSSIRVTSDRYGHLFPRARAEMADALEATFRAAAEARVSPACHGDLVELPRTAAEAP